MRLFQPLDDGIDRAPPMILALSCTIYFSEPALNAASVSLFEQWAAIACIGVLIDDGTMQLFLMCIMHTVTFVFLVVMKPFANW